MSQPKSVRDWARHYLDRGWALVPLRPESKEPVERGWQKTTITVDTIDDKFTDRSNIGLNLGHASKNLVDVDLDWPEAAQWAHRFLKPTNLIFGRPLKPLSHYLYQVPADTDVRRQTYMDPSVGGDAGAVILEIRGSGNQTMVPPSIHPDTGETLEWSDFGTPGETTLEDLKKRCGWLAAALLLGRHWSDWPGRHHAICLHLAGGLLRAGLPVDTVQDFVRAICVIGGDPDVNDRVKAVQSTKDSLDAGDREVSGFPSLRKSIGDEFVRTIIAWLGISEAVTTIPCTDHGNALRMVDYFGEAIRYVPDWGQWIIWDGARWRIDKAERIYAFARQISEKIMDEANMIADLASRDLYVKWAFKSQDAARIAAMIRIAKTDESLVVDSADLDRDPWLFNVKNGTINLRTGGLSPHDPKDLITKLSPVVYDPTATAPMWTAYLDRIMSGNQDLIGFLQRLAGYSMTGETGEQVFTVLWGPPGTGKTTFIETLRRIFGDYCTHTETSTLMVKNQSSRATPELARLQGARLVTATETEENGRIAISLVKQLSGGDRMTASNLYAPPFEFDPILKLWIATNHKPRIPADEAAIWDRLVFVPFLVDMRNSPDRIKSLKKDLIIEYPGILAWVVEGCIAWRKQGLGRPQDVIDATESYHQESDEVGDFLDDMTEIAPDGKVGSLVLYNAYRDWATGNGFRPLNSRRFKEKMQARGITHKKEISGMVWIGLTLHVPAQDDGVIDLSQHRNGATPFGRRGGS